MGAIHSLVYQPRRSTHQEPFRFNRVQTEQVNLIADHGIEGDFKAGRSRKRQLNVMSYETVQTLTAEGFKTEPGELGEQIVVRGMDVAALPSGTRLQFGDCAVIELTKPRTPCEWFEAIQGKPKEIAEGRVGMMARVITGGVVRVGDVVTVVEAVPERQA